MDMKLMGGGMIGLVMLVYMIKYIAPDIAPGVFPSTPGGYQMKAKWDFISTLKGLGHLSFGKMKSSGAPIIRFPGRPGVKWVRKKGTRKYYARRDK